MHKVNVPLLSAGSVVLSRLSVLTLKIGSQGVQRVALGGKNETFGSLVNIGTRSASNEGVLLRNVSSNLMDTQHKSSL